MLRSTCVLFVPFVARDHGRLARRCDALASAGIFLATLVAFGPALHNGFVDWDDTVNFLGNPHYRGLGWPQISWMLTTTWMGHWIPVTWLTLGLDYVVWGMDPFGYHLTAVILHALNGVLFHRVALRLLAAAAPHWRRGSLSLGAAVAAALFALHPLRVESVAWVTERRDLVSGCFVLLAVLAHLQACVAGPRQLPWRLASLACYALALASKAMVATLPAALVLLDIYPLRRLPPNWREWGTPGLRRVWLEKVPYAVLAVVVAGIAVGAVRAHAFFTSFAEQPPAARVAIAFYSLWFYPWKTLVPTGLSPLYELPARVDWLAPRFVATAVAVGIVTAAALSWRRRSAAPLAVGAAYAVLLAPVSGLLHNGAQLVADRYSYLPCLGWALLAGAGVAWVTDAGNRGVLSCWTVPLVTATTAVWVIALATLSWGQVQVWRTSETLWQQSLEVDPDCVICHHRLGLILEARGQLADAIRHYERGLAVNPDHKPSVLSLGTALVKMGRAGDAVARLQARSRRDPSDADLRSHLGFALLEQGRAPEAMEQLQEAVRLNPGDPQSLTNLGITLVTLKRPADAIPHLRRAVQLRSADPLPRFWLGSAYRALDGPSAAGADAHVP
jgi:tetratricopeptide (TPR) repeat protein